MGLVKDGVAPNKPIIPTYASSVFFLHHHGCYQPGFGAGHVTSRGR